MSHRLARRTSLNWQLRRDWAASGGGGTVADFNGAGLHRRSAAVRPARSTSPQGTGWGSDRRPRRHAADDAAEVRDRAAAAGGRHQPRSRSTRGNTCGDAGSASTGDFTGRDLDRRHDLRVAASGHFGVADRTGSTRVPLTAGTTANVQFVRFTMLGTQFPADGGTCPGPFSGCDFMDMSEMEVYGTRPEDGFL